MLRLNGLLNCTSTEELKEFLGDKYVKTEGDNVYYNNSDSECTFEILEKTSNYHDELIIIDNQGYLYCLNIQSGSCTTINETACSNPSENNTVASTLLKIENQTELPPLTDRLLTIIEAYANKEVI